AAGDGAPWSLKVKAPAIELSSVVAYVQPEGASNFEPAPLHKEGDAWVGTYKSAGGIGLGTARYFLEAVLTSGATIASGSSGARRQCPGIGVGRPGGAGATDHQPLAQQGGATGTGAAVTSENPFGLSDVAMWSIVGGAAVALVGGITLGVVLSHDPKPG